MPKCLHCEDRGWILVRTPEAGSGEHGLTVKCICQKKPDDAEPVPVPDDARSDLGYTG